MKEKNTNTDLTDIESESEALRKIEKILHISHIIASSALILCLLGSILFGIHLVASNQPGGRAVIIDMSIVLIFFIIYLFAKNCDANDENWDVGSIPISLAVLSFIIAFVAR